MNIISMGYSSLDKRTTVCVELTRRISDTVVKTGDRYEIQIEGQLDFESQDLMDTVVDHLTAAGVNIMPF